MRIIALDVHRSFAQTAILENGKLRDAGKIDLEYSRLLRFARKLKPDDEIVIEATGNTSAIVRVLLPFVGRGRHRQSDPGSGHRLGKGQDR